MNTRRYFLFSLFPVLSLLLISCEGSGGKGTSSPGREKKEVKDLDGPMKAYRKEGKNIAMSTGKTLMGTLKMALKEGGVPHAVKYCNTKALPITDSLAEVHNARIKRTSHKLRNPRNSPDPQEKKVLDRFLSLMEKGRTPEPFLEEIGDSVAFYAPIKVKGLCLNCHGKVGETMPKSNYQVIKEKYPEDEAVGFEVGDLRGIWSIKFPKKDRS